MPPHGLRTVWNDGWCGATSQYQKHHGGPQWALQPLSSCSGRQLPVKLDVILDFDFFIFDNNNSDLIQPSLSRWISHFVRPTIRSLSGSETVYLAFVAPLS